MPRKKKPASQLTDHELAHRVFGVRGHKQLKELLLQMEQKQKRQPPKRKRKA